jgi:DNA-binding transcriptional LysR family regulator
MPPNLINIKSLQILDTMERRGSFTKAAEELNKATSGTQVLYVENMAQRVQAILVGLGIDHVPRYRVESFLKSG